MWNILGITPTNDIKAIKRAYAVRLKSTSPEDDPAAFQALRGAYEQAIRTAEIGCVADNLIEQEDDNIVSNQTSHHLERLENQEAPLLQPIHENPQAKLWHEADVKAKDFCESLLQTFTAIKARDFLNERLKDEWFISLDSKYFFERCLINKVAEKIEDFCDEPLEVLIRTFNWVDSKHILWQEEHYAMQVVWQNYLNRKAEVQYQIKDKKKKSKTNFFFIWLVLAFLLKLPETCNRSEPKLNQADQQAVETQLEQLKRDHTIHSKNEKHTEYWGSFDAPDQSPYNEKSIQGGLDAYAKIKEAEEIVNEANKENAK